MRRVRFGLPPSRLRCGVAYDDPSYDAALWSALVSRSQRVESCLYPNLNCSLDGYVYIGVRGRPMRAHRFSYSHNVGPIPAGMLVCHHCDNRACIEPSHLYAGTHADNMADKLARPSPRVADTRDFVPGVRPLRYGPLRKPSA